MVAGRRLRGEDEQQAAEHDACGSGELGPEALEQHRFGTREARDLGRGVEARRTVDQQDHRGADRPEHEDRAPEAGAVAAGGEERQRPGEQCDRDQRIGVGVDRCLEADLGGAGDTREAGVARLTDLYPAVVDELGGEQAGSGGDYHAADRPLGGDDRAGSRRPARRPGAEAPRGPIGGAERAQERDRDRAQAPSAPARQALGPAPQRAGEGGEAPRPPPPDAPGVAGGEEQRRLGGPQQPVHAPVGAAAKAHGNRACGSPAAPRRCYYSASLGPLVTCGPPRAREGLFLAPTPAIAGGPVYRSSPLHDNTFTLRPCHAAFR
jgi:hypothetical protein